MSQGSYEQACLAIDRANREDPAGHELPYSERMVGWVGSLAPRATPVLLLAARAQHIRRWTIPRAGFPEGRSGYLKWRETLKKFHAETLAEIMKEAGYDGLSIEKARQILLRKNQSPDPEGQTLEDAACLVFLQFEFAAFSAKTAPEKVVEILQKTWLKMSPAARKAAEGLPYGGREAELLKRALRAAPQPPDA
jgi:hypothetical protein